VASAAMFNYLQWHSNHDKIGVKFIDFSILLRFIVKIDRVDCSHCLSSYCSNFDFQNYCYISLYFGILISGDNSTKFDFTKNMANFIDMKCFVD
jgi:hypothetical protein